MFQTDLLPIISSLNTVFTATDICYTEILKMGKITGACIYRMSREECARLRENVP